MNSNQKITDWHESALVKSYQDIIHKQYKTLLHGSFKLLKYLFIGIFILIRFILGAIFNAIKDLFDPPARYTDRQITNMELHELNKKVDREYAARQNTKR